MPLRLTTDLRFTTTGYTISGAGILTATVNVTTATSMRLRGSDLSVIIREIRG